jgi:hypothetical protein
MSKIKELKTNPNNVLNLISMLELFSPEGKTKYVELLLNLMKSTPNIKEHVSEVKTYLTNNFEFIKSEQLNDFSDLQLMMIYRFVDSFFNTSDLNVFRKFCEYNERGLISQNDLTKYKSFDDVISATDLADLKNDTKDMENQTIKIYEDNEWLLIRPLTYLSSKKYGSNTKWCTTSVHNSEYFIKYADKGVLIYCINKLTGYKVAQFFSLKKGEPEYSFWDQKDERIDSSQSELPDELILFLRSYNKKPDNKPNRFLLDKEIKNKEDELLKTDSLLGVLREEPVNEEPVPREELHRTLNHRIMNAVRREADEIGNWGAFDVTNQAPTN